MTTCSIGGCSSQDNDCNRIYTYIPTKDIFTPYAYTVIPINPTDDTRSPKYNYDEYNLFCLRTRLAPHVKSLGLRLAGVDSWGIRFEPLLDDIIMRIAVVIYNGDVFVPVTDEFYEELQDLVDLICNDTYIEEDGQQENIKDYCLLIHSTFSIYYKGVMIDKVWLSSVLPYIPLPSTVIYSQSFDTLYGYPSLYLPSGNTESDGVYIKLERKFSYTTTYNKLYLQTLDIIHDFYTRGTIILDSQLDSNFIQLWGLTQNNVIKTNTNIGVYHPGWINRWIAPNPTKFLLDRRSGIPYIPFSIPDDLAFKHGISIKLKKHNFRFVFSNNEVLVWVRNIIRADLAHTCVVSGMSYVKAIVITDTRTRLPNVLDINNTVKYRDIKHGIVTSVLV